MLLLVKANKVDVSNVVQRIQDQVLQFSYLTTYASPGLHLHAYVTVTTVKMKIYPSEHNT